MRITGTWSLILGGIWRIITRDIGSISQDHSPGTGLKQETGFYGQSGGDVARYPRINVKGRRGV